MSVSGVPHSAAAAQDTARSSEGSCGASGSDSGAPAANEAAVENEVNASTFGECASPEMTVSV